MDGKWLLRQLRGLLNEDSDSDFLSDVESYSYLYDAAVSFAGQTRCLKNTQSITTVADQTDYTLSADFVELYLKNRDNRFYLKYNDGAYNTFITFKDHEDIIYSDNTDSVVIPDHFTIQDEEDLGSRISGTTTSAGASVGGESSCTDSGGGFSGYASVGDAIHNTTDGSEGVVLAVVSDTVLTTAMFDGAENDWTSGDAYIIQPQGRLRIILDPPPATSGHTVTIQYAQRPDPVYSDYGIYRFQNQYASALIKYAAWLYKYSDLDPQTGNAYYQYWKQMVKEAKGKLDKTFRRTRFTVNPKKRRQ
jgi:hypothetical protein